MDSTLAEPGVDSCGKERAGMLERGAVDVEDQWREREVHEAWEAGRSICAIVEAIEFFLSCRVGRWRKSE